ncbi:MAG: enoyl-CoA hydratase [Gammaproteobacteria bacterium]|nr:enoyl-CoA hydratase [Gammaproteobacteria bacterium]MBU2287541.1 enoyl-CoA hydratase [Gammaproteobacteria bacterium]
MSEVLKTRREGAVQVLINHNPAARNALSIELYHALLAALADAQADPSVGALVLTGADNFFCSGGNLNNLATRRDLSVAKRRESLEGLNSLVRAFRACPKPVVAAVEGGAAGAGLSLAMACDLLVTTPSAFFSLAYVKVGLTPDGGATSFLAEFVSRQVLTELCLTGDRVNGERMQALGVVNRLVPAGTAEAEAIALAQQISRGPEQAMARIKSLCLQAHHNSFEAQLELEADYMVEAQATAESAEGIGAFLGKRAADFAALRGKV